MLICLLAYLVNQEAAIGLHGEFFWGRFPIGTSETLDAGACDATFLVDLVIK
jgi:hypothetical protein